MNLGEELVRRLRIHQEQEFVPFFQIGFLALGRKSSSWSNKDGGQAANTIEVLQDEINELDRRIDNQAATINKFRETINQLEVQLAEEIRISNLRAETIDKILNDSAEKDQIISEKEALILEMARALQFRVEKLERIKISDTSKDEMIKQLRLLKTKEEGVGMSFSDPSPSRGGMASINLYGDRARAAIWLFKNADQIADILESINTDDQNRSLPTEELWNAMYQIILSSMWSPASGPVVWTETKKVAATKQALNLTNAIVNLIFPPHKKG